MRELDVFDIAKVSGGDNVVTKAKNPFPPPPPDSKNPLPHGNDIDNATKNPFGHG